MAVGIHDGKPLRRGGGATLIAVGETARAFVQRGLLPHRPSGNLVFIPETAMTRSNPF